MNKRTMAIAAVLLALTVQPAFAANLVGYNYVSVPANSDVIVTVPFSQAVANTLTATGTDANGVFVSGGLTAGQYDKAGDYRYYVRFTSGGAQGLWSSIESNTANEIVLQDTAILAAVSNNDTFVVVPHETFASVFPDHMVNVSFLSSLNTTPAGRRTEILTYDNSGFQINRSPSIHYYRNGAWQAAAGGANVDNKILPPQQFFILRNKNNANTLKYFALGNVNITPLARNMSRDPAQKNDVIAGSGIPTQMTLSDLNLGGTAAFMSSLNTTPGGRRDELLVYSNTDTGFNKAPKKYYYYNGWRFGSTLVNDVLVPGSNLVIRRYTGAGTQTWVQPAPQYFTK